jgi:hypothetical protein
MNHITIEFCKEDRQRIDELISIASLLVTTIQGQRITPEEFAAGTVAPQHPVDAPATHLEVVQVAETHSNAEESPAVEPIVENPAPIIIPFAEFQKAVTLAVSKGPEAKKAAKAIVNKFAASVSDVPEEKRAEVMAELAKI